jgi:GGDEF domain-containing protein
MPKPWEMNFDTPDTAVTAPAPAAKKPWENDFSGAVKPWEHNYDTAEVIPPAPTQPPSLIQQAAQGAKQFGKDVVGAGRALVGESEKVLTQAATFIPRVGLGALSAYKDVQEGRPLSQVPQAFGEGFGGTRVDLGVGTGIAGRGVNAIDQGAEQAGNLIAYGGIEGPTTEGQQQKQFWANAVANAALSMIAPETVFKFGKGTGLIDEKILRSALPKTSALAEDLQAGPSPDKVFAFKQAFAEEIQALTPEQQAAMKEHMLQGFERRGEVDLLERQQAARAYQASFDLSQENVAAGAPRAARRALTEEGMGMLTQTEHDILGKYTTRPTKAQVVQDFGISREEAGTLIKKLFPESETVSQESQMSKNIGQIISPAKPSGKPPEYLTTPESFTHDVKSIIDVNARIERDLGGVTDPAVRERMSRKYKDYLLGDNGVINFIEFQDIQRELDAAKIPYIYERSDGLNLGGLNEYSGSHDKADELLKKVWGEIYAKRVQENGGVIARDKGDEFKVLWPSKSSDEVAKIRDAIESEIEAKVKELGLDKIPHPKREGLQTGSLMTDYGHVSVGKGREYEHGKYGLIDRAADERALAAKAVRIKNIKKSVDETTPLVYTTDKGVSNEPRSTVETPGAKSEAQPGPDIGAPVQERTLARDAGLREESANQTLGAEPTPEQPLVLQRKVGLRSQAGKVGGKQKRLSASTPVEVKLDANDAAVRNKLKFDFNAAWDRFKSRWVERTAPVRDRLVKDPNGKIALMRLDLIRGSSAAAKQKVNDVEKAIYSTIPHEDEDLFNRYLLTSRISEVDKLTGGKHKNPLGITGAEADSYINDLRTNNPVEYASIKTAADKYQKAISTDVLNYLVDEGIMTRQVADDLLARHQHYSPLEYIQHIDPAIEGTDMRGRRVSVSDSGIKRLEGGSEQAVLSNPRLFLNQVIGRAENRVRKNRASKALYEFAQKAPDNTLGAQVEQPLGFTEAGAPKWKDVPADKERIFAMIDGKQNALLMDRDMAQYWNSQDPEISAKLGAFLNTVTGNAILKPMATGFSPEFAAGNMPRDIAHVWLTTQEYSPTLPIAMVQFAADLKAVTKDVFSRAGTVREYIEQGGGMDFLTNQGQLMKEGVGAKGSARESLEELQHYASWVGETSELWTRLALRRRAILNGKTPEEATWIARNYMDFGQGGSWVKALDKIFPYFSAAVVATRGVGRALGAHPALTSAKIAQIAGLGASISAWNRAVNREAWDSISDREKETRWILTTPWSFIDKNGEKQWLYIGIPKDQIQRLFATIGEGVTEMAESGAINKDRMSMAVSDLSPVPDLSSLPPVAQAMIAYRSNLDLWTNKDIWMGRKGVSPKEEYYATTPAAAVKFGQLTGMSPERTRVAFGKIVAAPNLYTDVAGALAAPKETAKASDAWMSEPFAQKLSEIPMLRRFVRHTYPMHGGGQDLMDKADKYNLDIKDEKGRPLPVGDLKKKVETAERNVQDTRIVADRQLDTFVARAGLGDKTADQDLEKHLTELEKKDPEEYQRQVQRLRTKYPDFEGGIYLMKSKIMHPNTLEDKLKAEKWYKEASPETKRKLFKAVGPDLIKRVEQMSTAEVDALKRVLRDKKLTTAERIKKMKEMSATIKKIKSND